MHTQFFKLEDIENDRQESGKLLEVFFFSSIFEYLPQDVSMFFMLVHLLPSNGYTNHRIFNFKHQYGINGNDNNKRMSITNTYNKCM